MLIDDYMKLDNAMSLNAQYHLRVHVFENRPENLTVGIYKESYALNLFYPYRMTKKELSIMKSVFNVYGFHDICKKIHL